MIVPAIASVHAAVPAGPIVCGHNRRCLVDRCFDRHVGGRPRQCRQQGSTKRPPKQSILNFACRPQIDFSRDRESPAVAHNLKAVARSLNRSFRACDRLCRAVAEIPALTGSGTHPRPGLDRPAPRHQPNSGLTSGLPESCGGAIRGGRSQRSMMTLRGQKVSWCRSRRCPFQRRLRGLRSAPSSFHSTKSPGRCRGF